MTHTQVLSLLLFIISLLLISTETIHRTYAALMGAFGMVCIGAARPEELLHLIDIEILAVVLGLFLLVRGAERSGLFRLLASKVMENSKSPTSFAVILLSFTMLLSIFMSNIGAMLVTTTLTITMARSLKIEPQTLLIFGSILSNIGGMMLLMSSIPNVIIALEGGLSFRSFLVNVVPLVLILYSVTLLIFVKLFKSEFTPKPETEIRDLEFDEWMKRSMEISGLKVMRINWSQILALVVVAGTVVGFLAYEWLNLTPAFVAITGGCLMLIVQGSEPARVLRHVDWSTILFLAGIFVMINCLDKVGTIGMISGGLSSVLGKAPFNASIALMWLSGIASSIVDNIPLSTSLAPIVKDLVQDERWKVVWWGLLFGVNLGGNMTPIGSPSTIIALGVSEQEGYRIPFTRMLKIGSGITVLHFGVSMLYLYLRYGMFPS